MATERLKVDSELDSFFISLFWKVTDKENIMMQTGDPSQIDEIRIQHHT